MAHDERSSSREVRDDVREGGEKTPIAVLTSVGAVVFTAVAIVTAVALLIYWLG